MKSFPFSLTFSRQLVLREGLFGTAGSLIPYFLKGFIITKHSDVTTISTILRKAVKKGSSNKTGKPILSKSLKKVPEKR